MKIIIDRNKENKEILRFIVLFFYFYFLFESKEIIEDDVGYIIYIVFMQLKNIKIQDNKLTLVYFLVSIIEEKYSDLVQFQDDFIYLEKVFKGKFISKYMQVFYCGQRGKNKNLIIKFMILKNLKMLCC